MREAPLEDDVLRHMFGCVFHEAMIETDLPQDLSVSEYGVYVIEAPHVLWRPPRMNPERRHDTRLGRGYLFNLSIGGHVARDGQGADGVGPDLRERPWKLRAIGVEMSVGVDE